MTYDQAFKDRQYLWSISPAWDMTGGYVDQRDLEEMFRSPTKATAKVCLCRQIRYWFSMGPETEGESDNSTDRRVMVKKLISSETEVRDIAKRHGIF